MSFPRPNPTRASGSCLGKYAPNWCSSFRWLLYHRLNPTLALRPSVSTSIAWFCFLTTFNLETILNDLLRAASPQYPGSLTESLGVCCRWGAQDPLHRFPSQKYRDIGMDTSQQRTSLGSWARGLGRQPVTFLQLRKTTQSIRSAQVPTHSNGERGDLPGRTSHKPTTFPAIPCVLNLNTPVPLESIAPRGKPNYTPSGQSGPHNLYLSAAYPPQTTEHGTTHTPGTYQRSTTLSTHIPPNTTLPKTAQQTPEAPIQRSTTLSTHVPPNTTLHSPREQGTRGS